MIIIRQILSAHSQVLLKHALPTVTLLCLTKDSTHPSMFLGICSSTTKESSQCQVLDMGQFETKLKAYDPFALKQLLSQSLNQTDLASLMNGPFEVERWFSILESSKLLVSLFSSCFVFPKDSFLLIISSLLGSSFFIHLGTNQRIIFDIPDPIHSPICQTTIPIAHQLCSSTS